MTPDDIVYDLFVNVPPPPALKRARFNEAAPPTRLRLPILLSRGIKPLHVSSHTAVDSTHRQLLIRRRDLLACIHAGSSHTAYLMGTLKPPPAASSCQDGFRKRTLRLSLDAFAWPRTLAAFVFVPSGRDGRGRKHKDRRTTMTDTTP